ncbi:MAG: phage holin family protein [Paludibacteraceae bacterium]|nr:phage holin family protein [Paludibacteraceae bacterium]
MNTSLYNQLLADIQTYIKSQLQLLKVQSIEQTSQLLGLIIALFAITAIVVVGVIFLAIALAAWLEQWMPMWASYLVIAGGMGLIALGVYWGRRLWFVRPIEKHLSEVIMDSPAPLKQQKQAIENQSAMQRELLERDIASVQRDWAQVQQLFALLREIISPKKEV